MPVFKQEKLTLTPEEQQVFDSLPKGEAAALKTGTSATFLNALIFAALKQKCIAIVRGSIPQSAMEVNKPFQPKPPWIKAKTTNWDFIKGYIAVRSLITVLGRKIYDEQTQNYKIITTALGDIPDEQAIKAGELDAPLVFPMRVRIKKEEIINHTIIHQDTTAIILVANDDPHPKGQRMLFKLDLTESYADGFSLYCKNEAFVDAPYQPVEILSMLNQNGELVPVKADKDLCVIAPAKEIVLSAGTSNGIPAAAMEVNDTYTTGGRVNLLEGWIALNPDIANHLSDIDVVHYGCVSPIESQLISLINNEYNKTRKLDQNPVQHSGENHNPEVNLSSLNTPMLHIILKIDGTLKEIVATESEKQFAFLALSYAEHYYFEIHPRWNMKYWAAVIEKQIISGYSINAETMINYLAYKKNESVPNSELDETAFLQYVYQTFNESVTLNPTFLPIDRVYISPIQKMALWAPTLQQQLARFRGKTSVMLPMPHVLLTYYQHQFKVIDKIVKGRTLSKLLLSKNHAIFEKSIINEILMQNKAAEILIHPEFNLEKWLPVMIRQLELMQTQAAYTIDPITYNAYLNYLQNSSNISHHELADCRHNPSTLLLKLQHVNHLLAGKSQNTEHELYTKTLLTQGSTMRTLTGVGFHLGNDVAKKTAAFDKQMKKKTNL